MPKRFWHYFGIVAAVAVFAAAVWALTWQLRDLRWDDLFRQLEAIPLHRILAAVAATFAAYLVLAAYESARSGEVVRFEEFLAPL